MQKKFYIVNLPRHTPLHETVVVYVYFALHNRTSKSKVSMQLDGLRNWFLRMIN